jgi:hypothetical protein
LQIDDRVRETGTAPEIEDFQIGEVLTAGALSQVFEK